jgi:N,N-dimethylformamidase
VYSSYRRPLVTMRPRWRWWATGAPRHFAADLRLVDWLQAHAYEHDVMTDHDLDAHGAALLGSYRVVILVGHPEYWTERMMDALEQHIRDGGRVLCLGGNALVWAATINPGRPWLMEVRKGPRYGVPTWESVHSTGEVGGEWSFRDRTGRRLLGVYYAGYGWPRKAAGYRALDVDERAAFIFDGVDRDELIGDFGAIQQGAAGDEFDATDRRDGTPPHALVVASSAGLHGPYEIAGGWSPQLKAPGPTGADNPDVRAEVVFFEGPNGGAVFAVGSINWCGSLAWNGYRNNVSQITRNVLDRFLMDGDLGV